jgi:hypothetical protein
MAMNVTDVNLKTDIRLSATFEFNAGVKQGDALSTVVLIVALRSIMKDIDRRGTIYTKSSQICAYADDTVIIARSGENIIVIYKEWEKKQRIYDHANIRKQKETARLEGRRETIRRIK